ncbi:MAG: hypothetical protein U0T84_08900 [Chitinophagales bacterium]
MKQFHSISLLALTVVLIALPACKKEDRTNWDTELLAPLGRTTLSIQKLVKDSIIKSGSDNSLTLSYQSTVYELNLADQYFHIPDTSIGQKFTVDSLRLPVANISYPVTLGNIATMMKASTDAGQQFFGNYVINNNGQMKTIPAISNIPVPPFGFDASQYFQTVTLSQGTLQIVFVDSLPIAVDNLQFQIKNNSGGVIVSDVISHINPFSSAYRNYNLAGKTVESSVQLQVTNFSSPGSNGSPVLIDTNNLIRVYGALKDLRASDATARFPSQDLVSVDQEVSQNIGQRKFTYIDCADGILDVYITSSIQEKLTLTYQLKGAYDHYGKPIMVTSVLPPATPGQPSLVQTSFSLKDHSISLTGSAGNKFNTYTQVIRAHVDSSGILRHITSDDSVHFDFHIRNVQPSYIKGYGGRDTIKFAGNAPFQFVDILGSSPTNALQFEKVNMSLSVQNGIGIDGLVKINSLRGTNQQGNTVTLTDNATNPIIGTPLSIRRATDFPLTPAISNFALNSATSNISAFISNLPNKLDYDVEVRTNPNGNNGAYNDFAYFDSHLKINLDLNIPLSLMANQLTLRDSFDFSLGGSPADIANIGNGVLHLITYTKFPIESKLLLVAYDSAWQALDTLANRIVIPGGELSSNCKVETARRNSIDIPADNARIDRLRSARHAIVLAYFNTKGTPTCNNGFVKIYSDYSLETAITADFKYKVKF